MKYAFQKISMPSPWKAVRNSAKILNKSMKLNWNFQKGQW